MEAKNSGVRLSVLAVLDRAELSKASDEIDKMIYLLVFVFTKLFSNSK